MSRILSLYTGLPTNAFQEETATGLVSAEEVEVPSNESLITQGGFERRSSINDPGHGKVGPGLLEKGGKEGVRDQDVKLVTWLVDDPENPRNFTTARKWLVFGKCLLSTRKHADLQF